MKAYTVVILGATGAVGREMMKILEARDFPVGKLILLAGPRSAGRKLPFRGEMITIRAASAEAFEGADLVLGAADAEVARRFAPDILAADALFVDNSSAFRLAPSVPLVVPEINPQDALAHHGIIANPNCSTIITAVAVSPIAALAPLLSMTASTYQAVSGAGAGGLAALEAETAAFVRGEACPPSVFPHPIACNLIPRIGSVGEDGYTAEELKLQNEGRRILHLPRLKASCTCVRVPVLRSHSISVSLHLGAPVTVEAARQAVRDAPGCRLVDDPAGERYPMPLAASDQDEVLVGRIRPDLTDPCGLCLWCCGDQLRKGAAVNAVQIAELALGADRGR